MPWPAAVVCGGASRRMGRDKALLHVDGTALAVRVAGAVAAAGGRPVFAVGGDGPGLEAAGLADVPARWVPDRWPGEGPLGGLLTALAAVAEAADSGDTVGTGGAGSRRSGVLVVACDLVAPDPLAMAATWTALERDRATDLVVPVDADGTRQWLHAAWRLRAADALEAAFSAGERALHRAVTAADLRVAEVHGLPPTAFADADTPEDLPGG